MPKKKTARKSEVIKLSDNESIQCCIDGQMCPLQASEFLKKRLFKHDNGYYLDGFLANEFL